MQQLDNDLVHIRTQRTALYHELRATTDTEQRSQIRRELNTCTEEYISLLERKIERLTVRCGSLRMLLDECARGYRFLGRDGSEDAPTNDEL
jgi:hypothetical protein